MTDCTTPAQFEFERLIRESPSGFVVLALVVCCVAAMAAYWIGYYRGAEEGRLK